MSEPTVSIIIPVYNRVHHLGATIASILAQSLPNWQLIVVDDGSTEDVGSALAPYADARILLLKQQNEGNAAARNAGLQRALAPYIACLDSDDVWEPEMLESCVNRLAAAPSVGVVYTQYQAIDSSGRLLSPQSSPQPMTESALNALLMGYPILPSSAVARRVCYEQWGNFTPGMDDWELWLRWALHGCRFEMIARPLLKYRLHEENLGANWEHRRAAHFAMLDKFYASPHLPEAVREMRSRAYANQHLTFSILGWQTGNAETAVAEAAAAVQMYPPYVMDQEYYYRIACAHQGRLNSGTSRGLSLDEGEVAAERTLEAIFSEGQHAELQSRRKSAYAVAYLALARIAYGLMEDNARARRYLLKSLAVHPTYLGGSSRSLWLLRSLAGRQRLARAKGYLEARPATRDAIEKSPAVSVIVPCYNHGRYLTDALQSVLGQTLTDWELIVVDDGSTDDTRSVAMTYDDPRIRYVYQHNQGLSAARNTGIQQARGAYLAFLDADDMWEAAFLERTHGMLVARPDLAGVYAQWSFAAADGSPLTSGGHSVSAQPFKQRILEGGYFPVHTALIRRQILDAVGLFDTRLTSLEDWDLWLRVSFQSDMGSLPDLLARYRVSTGSMSTHAERMHRNRLAILAQHFGAPGGAPETWPETKRYAYAFAYRIAAVAFAQQQDTAASEEFWKLSATTWPPILERLDTPYEHLCGDQPRDVRGRAEALDISDNSVRTRQWLDEMLAIAQGPYDLPRLRRNAFGSYFLAQAMLFDQAGDWRHARRSLQEALRANPALARDPSVLRRLAKLTVGKGLLGRPTDDAPRPNSTDAASGRRA